MVKDKQPSQRQVVGQLPYSDLPKCPVAQCRLKVDLVLESLDGVRFGTHAKNLETFSGGFPPLEFHNPNDPQQEIVSLPESSNVVSLLLQYMHHQRQPDSSTFSFDILSQLAEATEKYMVFPATEVCKVRMKEVIPDHPLPVLKYAVVHDYPELSDLAAPFTITLSLDEVKKGLEDRLDIFIAWVQYRECWWDVLSVVFDSPISFAHSRHKCSTWPDFYELVVSKLRPNLGMVRDIEKHIKSYEFSCVDCRQFYARRWSEKFADRIARVPKFTKFL